MAEADTQSDTEEEQVEYAWASQTPGTRIKGTPVNIIYAGQLNETTEQNGTSFGLVLKDPQVVKGELWKNQEKPDDGTTADGVDEDQSRPTDYRVADSDDDSVTVANGALVTGEEGPNTYDEADEFDEDVLIVWYNGLSGGRIGRTLDFNGRPFARWTDDNYLVKGLMQPAEGWRGANGEKRSQMAQNGKAPRVARAPILRQRVEYEYDDDGSISDVTLLDEPKDQELLIDMSRAQSGRGYRVHVFDAAEFAKENGNHSADAPRNEDGYIESDAELEWEYSPVADDVLEDAEYRMHLYTGDGWQDEPANWEPQSTSAVGTFGVEADSGESVETDGFTAKQEQFIREVVDAIKGSGMTPEEAFDGGLAGLMGRHQDSFDRVPDVEDVREEVYRRVAHLDTGDLDD